MIDFDALVLGPTYQLFGVEAVIVLDGTAGREETLTVQDHSKGVQIGFIGSKGHVLDAQRADLTVASLRPAAAVRTSELADKSLDLGDLRDSEITFNRRTWRIKGHAPKPGPNGDGSGEIFLLLEGIDA